MFLKFAIYFGTKICAAGQKCANSDKILVKLRGEEIPHASQTFQCGLSL